MVLTLWLAFFAGIVSFVSPCTLPLFPSYLGYITGLSFEKGGVGRALPAHLRRRVFLHSACFCLGLSCIFVALGLGFTELGQMVRFYKNWVRIGGGFIVIFMGLFMAGMIKMTPLLREYRLRLPRVKRVSYIGSFLVGIIFAAGWTPCIGSILSTVLALVVGNPEIGYRYMVVYALGFSIPFLALSTMVTWNRPLLRYTEVVRKIGGWILVVAGILLITGKMELLAAWLQQTIDLSRV